MNDDPAIRTMARCLREARVELISAIVLRLRADGFTHVRVPHIQIFENLDALGVRLTTLAERCHMSHQAMGQLVDELLTHGYVVRVADPDDGRARLVQPAPLGADAIDHMWSHLAALRAAWQRELPDGDADRVVAAVDALVRICQGSAAFDVAPARRP